MKRVRTVALAQVSRLGLARMGVPMDRLAVFGKGVDVSPDGTVTIKALRVGETVTIESCGWETKVGWR